MRNRVVSQTKLGPTINTMGRRILVLSMVLASTTSIAAPEVQQGDEFTRWPSWVKPSWDPHKVPESLCDLNKEIISYTCELVNHKTVSVCASRNLTPETGYIVYRYGLPGNIELTYPKELRNPVGLFFYSSTWAQLGGQTSLSFFNEPYRYTVFNHWFVKGKDTVFRAGVSVRNKTKIVFQKMCVDNSYYTTGRVFSETAKSHHWGTHFVFDFPSGLNLKADEFIDMHVANESRN